MKKIALALAALSLMVAGTLLANHHTYVTAMKGVGGLMGSTGKALEGGDMAAVETNAAALNQHLTVMAAWWEGRGSSAAFKLAEAAANSADAMGKAAGSGDGDAAKAAFGEIRGSCKTCHDAHRVKNDDGSWGFKN